MSRDFFSTILTLYIKYTINGGGKLMTGIVVAALIGVVAQLVDGSLGMAYGVTSTSLLLAGGLTPAAASASVHLAEVGTTMVSGLAHWRFGNVDRRVLIRIAGPGAVGAFCGAVFLSWISLSAAQPITSGVLLALGVYVIIRFASATSGQIRGRAYVRGRHLAVLGGIAGFVDASGGGGWGPIATPTLLATGKMEPRKVIGSVSAAEFAVAAAASAGFGVGLGMEGVSFVTVAGLLIGGALAAPVAAWLVRKVVPEILGVAVGGLIVLTNARTILAYWDVPGSLWILGALTIVWALGMAAIVARRRRRALPDEPPALIEAA